jgi:SAM-dependent methyltransferase
MSDREEVYRSETISAHEKEWLGKEIKPITLGQVRLIMRKMHADVLDLSDFAYTTTRGVQRLLDEKSCDYARLPSVEGNSAMQVFRSLKDGDEWLDLGCGSGNFVNQVIKEINPGIKAVGFDARRWSDQEEIPELVLGDIDQVNRSSFQKHPNGFDLISSASVFYHLPDYWGALARAIDLLKPDGRLLISTINRPMSGNEPIDDIRGNFIRDPEDYWAIYYRNRNIFDADGKLLSMADAVQIFNSNNPGFRLEYHSGKSDNVTIGEQCYGGGFSGKKLTDAPINMSFVFYCLYPKKGNDQAPGITDLSFIFAKSEEEARRLRSEAFVSVQDRFK